MECRKCGVCCIAPDISTLGKPYGIRCKHLSDDLLCLNYENRPAVCRNYKPCNICDEIYHPDLETRLRNYKSLFDIN